MIDHAYIAENTFEGAGVQEGNFFFIKPSGFVERVPAATTLNGAIQICTKRHMKQWNHAFDIGFAVHTKSEEPFEATNEEILEGLEARLQDLRQNPQEIKEAIGYYNDSFSNWE